MATANHKPAALFHRILNATSPAERNAARHAWSMAEEEYFRRSRKFYEELGTTVEINSGGVHAAHEVTAAFCRSLLDPYVEMYHLTVCWLDAEDCAALNPSKETRADCTDALQELVRRHEEIAESNESLLRCLAEKR